MCRRRERGVALVAAVGGLAVLSALAVGFAYTAVVDQHLARNAVAAVQADALARSGVAAAAVVLRERGDGPDTLAAPWARGSGRQPLGAGWVAARVEDEARRLDLNAPELRPALPRLLAALGLDAALADAIADFTDPDHEPRPHGAEAAWYRARVPPILPPDGPLASVGQLGHVRGLDAAALARLRPHVTVAGERAVNPNTASREVLLAVLGDTALAERVLVARARGPLDDDALAVLLPDLPASTAPLLTARSQRYTVRVVASVGELRRGLEATLWAPAGSEADVIAWGPFVPGREALGFDMVSAPR